jgi:hypothetical protein
MSDNIEIRRAREGDADAVLQMIVSNLKANWKNCALASANRIHLNV